MTMQLRRIIFFAPHLAEMADFYSNVLGPEVTNREDGGYWSTSRWCAASPCTRDRPSLETVRRNSLSMPLTSRAHALPF